jgi:hypothetical protein
MQRLRLQLKLIKELSLVYPVCTGNSEYDGGANGR